MNKQPSVWFHWVFQRLQEDQTSQQGVTLLWRRITACLSYQEEMELELEKTFVQCGRNCWRFFTSWKIEKLQKKNAAFCCVAFVCARFSFFLRRTEKLSLEKCLCHEEWCQNQRRECHWWFLWTHIPFPTQIACSSSCFDSTEIFASLPNTCNRATNFLIVFVSWLFCWLTSSS